jgi:hypothetical protein
VRATKHKKDERNYVEETPKDKDWCPHIHE